MNNPARTGPDSALDREAQALAHALDRHHAQRPSAARQLARGLGWFGIGLGLMELLASRRVARASGLRGGSLLLPLYGLREIASGAGLVTARNAARTAPWAWSRVAGDAIDIATLLAAAAAPRRRATRPLAALVAVAGVTLLDIACARTLRAEAHAARQRTDYSGRSGLGPRANGAARVSAAP